jgi:transposase
MPPADEVVAAYQQVGTVSGLADHFGVPRHTVQGWARRLRRQGYQIGRAR